jgi:Kunitz-type protease inhibitor 1
VGHGAGGNGSGGSGPDGGEPGAAGAPSVDVCALPLDPGPCRGAVPRFAFRAETGKCEMFTYGGCEGNENNFPNHAACFARCGAEEDLTRCDAPSACALASSDCCGPCEPVAFSSMVALNQQQAADFHDLLGCNVACEMCEPTQEPRVLPWLFASCVDDHCVAFDAREHDVTQCSKPADCRLRYGMHCCEPCAADPADLIALSGAVDLDALLCGAESGCPPCVPTYPADAGVDCVSGRCVPVLP